MSDPELRPKGAAEPENGYQNGDNNVRSDLNLRIIRSLCRFVEETYGSEKLDALSWEAGIPVEQLHNCRGWISLEQAEAIMHRIHSWVGSDQAFMNACIHRMKERLRASPLPAVGHVPGPSLIEVRVDGSIPPPLGDRAQAVAGFVRK